MCIRSKIINNTVFLCFIHILCSNYSRCRNANRAIPSEASTQTTYIEVIALSFRRYQETSLSICKCVFKHIQTLPLGQWKPLWELWTRGWQHSNEIYHGTHVCSNIEMQTVCSLKGCQLPLMPTWSYTLMPVSEHVIAILPFIICHSEVSWEEVPSSGEAQEETWQARGKEVWCTSKEGWELESKVLNSQHYLPTQKRTASHKLWRCGGVSMQNCNAQQHLEHNPFLISFLTSSTVCSSCCYNLSYLTQSLLYLCPDISHNNQRSASKAMLCWLYMQLLLFNLCRLMVSSLFLSVELSLQQCRYMERTNNALYLTTCRRSTGNSAASWCDLQGSHWQLKGHRDCESERHIKINCWLWTAMYRCLISKQPCPHVWSLYR